VRWQHPNQSAHWRRDRYWGKLLAPRESEWAFKGDSAYRRRHSWTPINRQPLVRRGACGDDPDLEGYGSDRKARQASDSLTGFQRQVASDQKWVCPKCGDWILNGEEWHEHRVIPGQAGGKYTRDNVRLVHLFCHQAEHSGKKRAKDVE